MSEHITPEKSWRAYWQVGFMPGGLKGSVVDMVDSKMLLMFIQDLRVVFSGSMIPTIAQSYCVLTSIKYRCIEY